MAEDSWLTEADAVQLIRSRLGGSVGYANEMLRKARASGEVRTKEPPILLTADDGVVGLSQIPGWNPAPAEQGWQGWYDKDDLLDWLDRQVPDGKPATDGAPTVEELPRLKKVRSRGRRGRAGQAIEALWPRGIPDQAALSNKELFRKVIGWLGSHYQKEVEPSLDTVLRAAHRKKD